MSGYEFCELDTVEVAATFVGGGKGGVHLDNVTYAWVRRSMFSNMRHKSIGGAVYASRPTEVLISNSSIQNNSAVDPNNEQQIGSVLFLTADETYRCKRLRMDSIVVNDYHFGGMVLWSDNVENVLLLNSTFFNSSTVGTLAVVAIYKAQRALVQSSSFTSNAIGSALGVQSTEYIWITNCSFQGHAAGISRTSKLETGVGEGICLSNEKRSNPTRC